MLGLARNRLIFQFWSELFFKVSVLVRIKLVSNTFLCKQVNNIVFIINPEKSVNAASIIASSYAFVTIL